MRRCRLALVPMLLVAASACSGGGEDVPVDEGGDDGSGAGGTFVAAISAQPDQLDPHQTTAYASFQVLENVYDTLVVPDPEGADYEPSLAESWDVSDDGRTWTFHLRDGVTFHDGSTLEAADVVYSFDRIIDEELGDAYKFADLVEDVVATDEATVEFRLARPVPNMLDLVGNHKSTAILPEGAADDVDLATEAVGTGPFRLATSTADAITLAAFDDYWGEGPEVGEVEFRFVSEPTTAVTGLETGEIDWTDNVPVQRIDDLEDQDVEVGRVPSFDYWYMATNVAREPFDRPEVREAIALALDRQAIADAAQFGLAEVNQTAIPESSAWYHEYAPYERDVDRARELLDEAGVRDLTMGLMVTDEYPETVDVAEVIEANLSDVGIRVSIETEQFSTWLDRQGAGDFDAFMLGWLGNIDPHDFYHSQHVCEGANNYQGYCDRRTDDLLNRAASEMDEEERQRLYDQAAERIVDANSYIYLYNPSVVHAWSSDVSGYEVRPDKAVNFEAVSVS